MEDGGAAAPLMLGRGSNMGLCNQEYETNNYLPTIIRSFIIQLFNCEVNYFGGGLKMSDR